MTGEKDSAIAFAKGVVGIFKNAGYKPPDHTFIRYTRSGMVEFQFRGQGVLPSPVYARLNKQIMLHGKLLYGDSIRPAVIAWGTPNYWNPHAPIVHLEYSSKRRCTTILVGV